MKALTLFLRRHLPTMLVLLFSVAPASALETPKSFEGPSPVTLQADTLTYDEASRTYHAAGQVQLRKGGLSLSSDSVRWNTATGEAVAQGNVRLSEPAGSMEGEELRLNLQSGLGKLTDGRVYFPEQEFRIAGEEIEKFAEQSYRVSNGSFTTCAGETPSWKFGASELRVTLEGYARAKHVFFYLRDIPVLYVPYLIYPAKRERESGFLLPRYGYSERRGLELSLAYYRVLARNMDATFYLDYLSKLGVGKGLEYRYIFGTDNEGEIHGYHINGLSGEASRHALNWRHSGTLPAAVRLTADVELVSSRDYFEDFGEEAEEYTKDQALSVLYASRNWGKLNLAGQIKYTQDLEQNNAQTLQRLPEVRFAAIRQRLGDTPFFYRFDGASTYFWRREGLKGERLDARPALGAVFHPGNLLEIAPEIGYRERLYWSSEGSAQKGVYDFSTRISTRFSRIFFPEHKVVKKIRHSIEPELVYTYVPSEDQSGLPQFDAEDEIPPENSIGYALTNRFTARLEPESGETVYHDFLYLRFSQDFDLRESRRERLNPQDNLRPFSALRAEFLVRPTRSSYLDVDSRYDLYRDGQGFTDLNARGGVEDSGGNALFFDYRYRREDLEYLAGTLNLTWLKPVYLNFQSRYDLDGRRRLENVLNLEYRSQCWSVNLRLRDRLDDREYLITFALSGLGKVGQFGGNFGETQDEAVQ